jgi:hypothetical protein
MQGIASIDPPHFPLPSLRTFQPPGLACHHLGTLDLLDAQPVLAHQPQRRFEQIFTSNKNGFRLTSPTVCPRQPPRASPAGPKNSRPGSFHLDCSALNVVSQQLFPQQCLYFLPDPQPQESLRPIFRSAWRLPPPSSAAILRRSGPKYS